MTAKLCPSIPEGVGKAVNVEELFSEREVAKIRKTLEPREQPKLSVPVASIGGHLQMYVVLDKF
jgi:hypothetical protein